MNPIARFRIRAGSAALRFATGAPVQQIIAPARRIQQTEEREQRRLAARRRTFDRDVFSPPNREVDRRAGGIRIGDTAVDSPSDREVARRERMKREG
jgi:hypothetical protein